MTQGRRLSISTPEEFEEKSSDFFEYCLEHDKPATSSGLAYALGFSSRQSLYDYKKRDGFKEVVERAILFIESGYEMQMAMGRGDGGIVFALKNFGWTDKTQQEISGPDGGAQEHKWQVEFINAETKD